MNCINKEMELVESVAVSSTAAVGGIVGYNKDSMVSQCINYGKINAKSTTENRQIGGIVGYNWESSSSAEIINSKNYSDLVINVHANSGNTYIGGISGDNSGTLILNINYGTIDAEIENNNAVIGGISGSNAGEIQKCVNDKNSIISAKSYNKLIYCGGITGQNYNSTIISSHNKANLNIEFRNDLVGLGGIAGINNNAVLNNSYNIGIVTGNGTANTSGIAGIIGLSKNSSTIENSYYLNTTANNLYGYGDLPIIINSSSKTETEMKSSSFVDLLNQGLETPVWIMDTNNINNGYPILSFQNE